MSSSRGHQVSIKQANKLLFLPPAKEVWGKVMFLHLCVILFTGGDWLPSMHHRSHDQGVCLWGVCLWEICLWGVCIQGDLHPGWADSPPPPEIHGILQDTVNKRVVRILLECINVKFAASCKEDLSVKFHSCFSHNFQ